MRRFDTYSGSIIHAIGVWFKNEEIRRLQQAPTNRIGAFPCSLFLHMDAISAANPAS